MDHNEKDHMEKGAGIKLRMQNRKFVDEKVPLSSGTKGQLPEEVKTPPTSP